MKSITKCRIYALDKAGQKLVWTDTRWMDNAKTISAWKKYMVRAGFKPGTPGRKANTITTELKRILSNTVVRYCIKIRKQQCLKEWFPITIGVTK